MFCKKKLLKLLNKKIKTSICLTKLKKNNCFCYFNSLSHIYKVIIYTLYQTLCQTYYTLFLVFGRISTKIDRERK